MREIVLDTETTGLDPSTGHRLVEIGCVELANGIPSGRTFHKYLNPERDVPEEAFRVHGLSREFLADKPIFQHVVDEFLAFIAGARLVIHNAEFDMKFINAELASIGQPKISMDIVLDTLMLARRKHPGVPNSLDALCNRYQIDNSRRTKHGALLDSEILAEVYIELTGGHQKAMAFSEPKNPTASITRQPVKKRPLALAPLLQVKEARSHLVFLAEMGPNSIWQTYLQAVNDSKSQPPTDKA